jgi:hypothetical protein
MREMSEPSEDVSRLHAAINRAEAPPALRLRVERQIADVRRKRVRRARVSVAGALAAAAAAAAALVLVVGGASAPAVEAFVNAAAAPPASPAPPVDSSHPTRLVAHVGSVWFPNWRDIRWPAVGRRDANVQGRDATTIYYAGRDGTRVGYMIVAGGPLEWPDHGRVLTRHGVRFQIYAEDKLRVVTWRKRGHQCLIVAPQSVPDSRLVALAAADS